MEKLIELLNEYTKKEKFGIIRKIGEDPIGVYGYVNDKYGLGWASKLVIVSKEYGFIKWLVENEKVDLDGYPDIDFFNGDVNNLLMYLSIQDEPIEFLVSILK